MPAKKPSGRRPQGQAIRPLMPKWAVLALRTGAEVLMIVGVQLATPSERFGGAMIAVGLCAFAALAAAEQHTQ